MKRAYYWMLVPLLAGYLSSYGTSQTAKADTVTAVAPQAIPTLSPQELSTYWQRPLTELCTSRTQTVRDSQAVTLLNLTDKCKAQTKASNFWGNTVYGYEHPSSAACNGSNGLKTSAAAYAVGKSVGTMNFFSLLGAVVSLLFAGCNNAPAQSTTQSASQQAAADTALKLASTKDSTAENRSQDPPLVVSVDSLVLKPGQRSGAIYAFENNYADFFMVSASSAIASVSPGFGKPTMTGVYPFRVVAGSKPGSTTVTVGDVAGQQVKIDVTVAKPK